MIQLEPFICGALVVMARVVGFFYSSPLLSDKFISGKIRAYISAIVAMYVYMLLLEPVVGITYDLLPTLAFMNLVVGYVLGLMLSVAFNFLAFAGHLIAMSSGLGFSTLADPQNGTQITTVANFYKISGALIFVFAGGLLAHHDILIQSFDVIDLSLSQLNSPDIDYFLQFFRFCFNNALMIAFPVILTVLLVNVGFGVISKASPSMNIFAVGFPVSIVVTFVVVFMSIDKLPFFVGRYLSLGVYQ